MSKKTVIKFAVPVLLAIVLQQVVGGGLGSIFNSGKSSAPEEPEEGPSPCPHIRTNIQPATIFALILVAFSFLVELCIHQIEHALKNRPQVYKIVQAIYHELMLLGLIAILVFFGHETNVTEKIEHLMAKAFPVAVKPHQPLVVCSAESLNVLFEKVHLGISATMGIYFLTCIYLVVLHWIIYRHWIRIDYEAFDMAAYEREIKAQNDSHWLIRHLNLARKLRLWRLHGIDRIHALRASCIEQYQLPSDFQFSKYFKSAMRDVVIHVLEVHPVCWGILVISLLFTLARTFIKLRVNDSFWTIVIYGTLSLLIAALSVGIHIYATRIYNKVLTLPSVRRHLKTKTSLSSRLQARISNSGHHGHHEDDFEPYVQPYYDEENADTPLLTSHHVDRDTEGSTRYTSLTPGMQEILDQQQDDTEPLFDHLKGHKTMHFQVFRDHHEHVALMSVDDYRKYQARVTCILRRAQSPTTEDDEHKSMLFFRSKKLLAVTLQVITFIQTWLTGLSIYYLYSIYRDVPVDPPKHPAIIIYVFIGPLITYGLMGPTLSKIVKAVYTAGLVRPELLLETLFLPQSRHHPNASKSRKHHSHKHNHHDQDVHETGTDSPALTSHTHVPPKLNAPFETGRSHTTSDAHQDKKLTPNRNASQDDAKLVKLESLEGNPAFSINYATDSDMEGAQGFDHDHIPPSKGARLSFGKPPE